MLDGKNGWSSLYPFTPPLAWGERGWGNQRISIHLSAELTHEMDEICEKHKWDIHEVMAYRSWFIETAVRFFIAHLKEVGLIAE